MAVLRWYRSAWLSLTSLTLCMTPAVVAYVTFFSRTRDYANHCARMDAPHLAAEHGAANFGGRRAALMALYARGAGHVQEVRPS